MPILPTSFSRTERNVVAFQFGGEQTAAQPWQPPEHHEATLRRQAVKPKPVMDPSEAAFALREAELMAEVESAYAKGQADAQAAVAEELAAAAEQLGHATAALDQAAVTLESKYRSEAIELALAVARAVLGETLSVDDDALMSVVDRALSMVPRADQLVVQANPEDFDRMRVLVANAAGRRADPGLVRVESNPEVERNGVVVDFESGSVNASPSVAIELMREAIESAMAGRHEFEDVDQDPEDELDLSDEQDNQ